MIVRYLGCTDAVASLIQPECGTVACGGLFMMPFCFRFSVTEAKEMNNLKNQKNVKMRFAWTGHLPFIRGLHV